MLDSRCFGWRQPLGEFGKLVSTGGDLGRRITRYGQGVASLEELTTATPTNAR